MAELVVSEPEYGSGSRAIPMVSAQDVKYIRITDFDDEGIPPGHEFVTAETVEPKYTLQDGDVLFARSGATAGKTFIYSQEIGNAIFAGYCIRFRFNPELVLPRFAYYCTKTNRFAAWVRSMQRPSGQPNINKEEFKTFSIPLLPLDMQQAFVADLEAARAARKQKLAEADALLAGVDDFVLQQIGLTAPQEERRLAFAIRRKQIDEALNAERYANLRTEKLVKGREIGSIVDIVESKISPCNAAPDELLDWIRIDDLPNHPLEVEAIRTELGKTIDGSLFVVQENDILLARLGPTILNAKFVLCPQTQRKTVASGEFLVLRCREGWNPVAVLWILRTKIFRDLMYSKARGGTPSRYRLNREDLAAMKFPEIPSEVQATIAAEVTRRREQARRLRGEASAGWEAAKARFEQQLLGA